MAEISKITLPSGTTYSLKDTVARAAMAGTITLIGTTTTPLTDECTTNPIKIDGEDFTAESGHAVFYGKKEFIFDGTKWHEFGDMTGLGALAMKNSASGNFTPAGTVSQPTFSGTQATISMTYNPVTGVTVTGGTFTGTQGSVSVSGTPTGSITKGTGTANYTPEGTVSQPTTTVTLNSTTKYVAASSTGGGSATAGTAAACTLPVLTTSVVNENLTIGWTAGSFTANTPTAVTMPTFSSQTIATGVNSATTSQPTFTGTGAELKFSGNSMTSTGNFTPQGSVDSINLVAEDQTLSTTYTPAGTVSKPTFTGTQGTVTVS